jgi:hypothetical protein
MSVKASVHSKVKVSNLTFVNLSCKVTAFRRIAFVEIVKTQGYQILQLQYMFLVYGFFLFAALILLADTGEFGGLVYLRARSLCLL